MKNFRLPHKTHTALGFGPWVLMRREHPRTPFILMNRGRGVRTSYLTFPKAEELAEAVRAGKFNGNDGGEWVEC